MGFATVEIRRAYFRERYNGLRKKWFQENGPCRHCNSWDDLQVDHIDPQTKNGPDDETRLWNWSRQRREAELAKCQPLCAECHRYKSVKERREGKHKRFRRGKAEEAEALRS